MFNKVKHPFHIQQIDFFNINHQSIFYNTPFNILEFIYLKNLYERVRIIQ